jgi:protocatechuate 3,4-dioxygenase beta subunit
VRDAGRCEPIADAVVDIWHCDAGGVYSGFEAGEGERFLRGAQVTNADGIARFTTIYPGYYQGRTVHIHAKVHLDRQTVLTTQLYFGDDVSDRVFAAQPYAGQGARDATNGSDGIFDDSLLLTLERAGRGYLGLMTFDVSAT